MIPSIAGSFFYLISHSSQYLYTGGIAEQSSPLITTKINQYHGTTWQIEHILIRFDAIVNITTAGSIALCNVATNLAINHVVSFQWQ